MRRLYAIVAFFILLLNFSKAQEYNLGWGFAQFDGVLPNGMAIDSVNSVYAYVDGDSIYMERFIHGRAVTVDKWNNNIFAFDYVWGYYEMWAPYNYVRGNSGQDIAIRKSDDSGNEIWTKYLEGRQSNNPWAVKTDAEGNIIVCGAFGDSLDFDPGADEHFLRAAGGIADQNGFVLKLDTNGDFLFAKAFESSGELRCYDVAIDHMNNMYIVGVFDGTADFDPGPGVANATASDISGNLFAVKLDANGDYLWHYTALSNDRSIAYHCAVDEVGSLYMIAGFRDSIDISNTGQDYRIANGYEDGLLIKLDSEGEVDWFRHYSSSGSNTLNAVCFDGEDIVIAGTLEDSINVNPAGAEHWLYSSSSQASFFQKLDTAGNEIYAKLFAGGDVEISNIAVNSRKELFFSGSHYGQKIIQLPTGIDTIRPLAYDIYCGMVDADANLQWFASWPNAEQDYCFNSAVDQNGNVLLTGIYHGEMDLDLSDSAEYLLISEGYGHEAYLFQLDQCNQYKSIETTACSNYISPSSKYTWSVSGIYMDTLAALTGCDSILEINLTIVDIDTTLTVSNNTITSNYNSGTYQWINCADDSIIPFATDASYTATTNGSYAVQINDRGCVDTSACVNITSTSTEEHLSDIQIQIYPNPSTGQLYIQPSMDIGSYELILYNSLGQLAQSHQATSGQTFSIDLSKGIYWLEVRSGEGSYGVEKVVVE